MSIAYPSNREDIEAYYDAAAPPPFAKDAPPYEAEAPPSISRPVTAQRDVSTEYIDDIPDEAPPDYSYFDDLANKFTLRAPYIYAANSASINARYQLSLIHTHSGKPYKLRIRRLLGSESRRLSLASSHSSSSRSCSIDYDDDSTMYTIENLRVVGGSGMVIRGGGRTHALNGYIQLEKGIGGKWKFWHYTRNPTGDALREENEKKMQKYGYHAENEWFKDLLFAADGGLFRGKNLEWRDESKDLVAMETAEELSVVKIGLSAKMRDALITCWAAKRWFAGAIEWEKDLDIGRRRSSVFSV